MISAITLACAISSACCHSSDAVAITNAIDQATDDDRLRAVMVVYAWAESRLQVHPRAESWDARAGRAIGPWQLWQGGTLPLNQQAVTWLQLVERGGLVGVDSSQPRALHRLRYAEDLLDRVVP